MAVRENSFERSGFAVLPDVLEGLEVAEVDSQLAELVDGRAGTRCVLESRFFQRLAGTLRERLSADIGCITDLVSVQCTFFNKSPGSNWFVGYHQDRSVPVHDSVRGNVPGTTTKEGMTFVQPPDSLLSRLVAIRLHLDDSNKDNGPLRVVEGTHLAGTLSPDATVSLCKEGKEQTLTVSKGGVIAMRPLLLHASSKSVTPHPRRVLHFVFGPDRLPQNLKWRVAV